MGVEVWAKKNHRFTFSGNTSVATNPEIRELPKESGIYLLKYLRWP